MPTVNPCRMGNADGLLTFTLRCRPPSWDSVPRGGVCSEAPLLASRSQLPAGIPGDCISWGGGNQSELEGEEENPQGHQEHALSTGPRGSPGGRAGLRHSEPIAR